MLKPLPFTLTSFEISDFLYIIQGKLSGERKETNPVYTLLHQSGHLYNMEPWLKDFELDFLDQRPDPNRSIIKTAFSRFSP
ncbi:MAG: hypothetical protein H7839_11065 [Magnetococcus sp. YQC-5]